MKLPGMIEINYKEKHSFICHYSKLTLCKKGDRFYVQTPYDDIAIAISNRIHTHYLESGEYLTTEVSEEEYNRILSLFEGFSTEETKQINVTEAFNKFTKENYPDGIPIGTTVSITCEDGDVKVKEEENTAQEIPEEKPRESFVVIRESFIKEVAINTMQEFYWELQRHERDSSGLYHHPEIPLLNKMLIMLKKEPTND